MVESLTMTAMIDDDAIAAARLRMAFDLFVAGRRMMRQNLRRRHPDASEEEIERRLGEWMRQRPGAEHGDGVGRPVSWPRRSSAAT